MRTILMHILAAAAAMVIAPSLAALQDTPPNSGGDAPAPPSNLEASDHPWDGGDSVDLTWDVSPDDAQLESYQVLRAVATVGGQTIEPEFKHVEFVMPGSQREPAETTISLTVRDLHASVDIHDIRQDYRDKVDVDAFEASVEKSFPVGYVFRVVAIGQNGQHSAPVTTATPLMTNIEWFSGARLWLGVIVLIFCGAVVFWINHARQGKPIKVRPIAGLEAVDEAVGRATEMGRPCLFIPGIQDMNDIQTIAGLTVLSRVAKTAAEYDAKVEVPTARSLVMTAGRETVQAAYLEAGRPDAYSDDLIYYVTDEQFGYVAYLQGMMVREKPAACFYMGHFYAESLILAETGNAIGAIQVAGTAAPAQLPFFVAACDYTLIGEEFFAASAYLSGSPEQLGSLKGQDVGKLIVGALLILGVIMATVAATLLWMTPGDPWGTSLETIVEFLKSTVLT